MKLTMAWWKVGTWIGLMLIAGCATTSVGSRPVAEFTSPAALTAIAQRPAELPSIPKTAPVDLWQIERAPPPDSAQLPWQPKPRSHAGGSRLNRVVQTRRRMGLPAPQRLGAIAAAMTEQLAAVREGRKAPQDALHQVLQHASTSYEMAMRGYVIEASSLDELEIPEDVLRQPLLALDIGVTHHKAPGAAWAQYTILVVYAQFDNRA